MSSPTLRLPARSLAAVILLGCAWLAAGTAIAAKQEIPTTQKQYRLVRSGEHGYKLQQLDAPVRMPGAHEVLVRVHATSLNRRDVFVMKGQYPVGPRDSLVPLSDGAGEVVAVGRGVTRFKVGRRVAAIFFQRWLAGHPPADVASSALGGGLDGMLTQYATLSEEGAGRPTQEPVLRRGCHAALRRRHRLERPGDPRTHASRRLRAARGHRRRVDVRPAIRRGCGRQTHHHQLER